MRAHVLLALAMVWALAVPILAADREGGVSLDRVLPQIRRTIPGTFYDADGPFYGPNGQAAYRIKWMTPEGRIIWFYADARTGQVLAMGGRFGPPPDRRFRDERFRDWPPFGSGDRQNWGDDGGWGNDGGHGNRGDWGRDGDRHGGRGGDWGRGDGNRGGGWNGGGGHGHDGGRGGDKGPGGHGG